MTGLPAPLIRGLLGLLVISFCCGQLDTANWIGYGTLDTAALAPLAPLDALAPLKELAPLAPCISLVE